MNPLTRILIIAYAVAAVVIALDLLVWRPL
jgi:hypothetical protein